MKSDGLILLLKFPEQGKVKTRLAKTLGNELTYGLYECFIQDLLEKCDNQHYDLHLFLTPVEKMAEMALQIGQKHGLHAQQGADLGERMKNAFITMFKLNYERCIILGSDYPNIPAQLPQKAFKYLHTAKGVIAPSTDGGYYLLGFQREEFCSDVFSHVDWSTEKVFQQTMSIFNTAGIFPKILPEGQDIDEFADLEHLINGCLNKNDSFYASHTMDFIRKHKNELEEKKKEGPTNYSNLHELTQKKMTNPF